MKNVSGPFYGKVTDNKDDKKLGRVKVLLDIMGENINTDWIPVLSLYAGNEYGAYFIPEINDQVIVAFMDEKFMNGVVLGSIWSQVNKPPKSGENSRADFNQDGKNNLKFIKSRSGHKIILDDSDGDEKIQIIASDNKTRFEFSAKQKTINLNTDKDIKIEAKGKISIKAKEGDFKFDAGLSVKGNNINLTGNKDIKLKANTNISINGPIVKLN
jgi:phage baseplate assembly protein V